MGANDDPVSSRNEIPAHESNLAWGPITLFASLVLTVTGAMKHDLRWLLILAWPFGVFGLSRMAWNTRWRMIALVTSSIVVAGGLLILNWWLKPRPEEYPTKPTSQTSTPSPSRETQSVAPQKDQPTPAPKHKLTHRPSASSETAKVNNSGQVKGGVTAGPCSNVQIGGSGNQATTNCVKPPSPNVQLVTVYENQPHAYVSGAPGSSPIQGFESRYKVLVTGSAVPRLLIYVTSRSFVAANCDNMGDSQGGGTTGVGAASCSLSNIQGDDGILTVFAPVKLSKENLRIECKGIACNYLSRPDPD